jgi:hypothetical protein
MNMHNSLERIYAYVHKASQDLASPGPGLEPMAAGPGLFPSLSARFYAHTFFFS